jgi:hypothetical protein
MSGIPATRINVGANLMGFKIPHAFPDIHNEIILTDGGGNFPYRLIISIYDL